MHCHSAIVLIIWNSPVFQPFYDCFEILTIFFWCRMPGLVISNTSLSYAECTLQILVRLWASGDQNLSLSSFLMIREVASLLPDCLDFCLTKTYNAYLSSSKIVDNRNIENIDFILNCLVELYSLDIQKAGERAVISVGQLSAILRQASKTKGKVHINAYICSCACSWFSSSVPTVSCRQILWTCLDLERYSCFSYPNKALRCICTPVIVKYISFK